MTRLEDFIGGLECAFLEPEALHLLVELSYVKFDKCDVLP